MSHDPVLRVENLTKVFFPKRNFLFLKSRHSPYVASAGLSFTLKEGEILGILGPNGAGKTTLIQMLLGTLKPTKGKIFYFGKDFSRYRSESLQYVSHASAYNKLPASLTVLENLNMYGRLYGIASKERACRIERLLTIFNISSFAHQQTRTLSAGQMTRAMLAKAFLSNPKIVLLDEPTASLDPDIALETRQFILQRQKDQKVSIILTSHNMPEVAEVCNRVLVLQNGVIVEEDTPQKLAKSVALTQMHLTLETDVHLAVNICKEFKVHFYLENNRLTVEIDEKEVPNLIHLFFKNNVLFTQIEINKPSLENYFLHISRQKKNKGL